MKRRRPPCLGYLAGFLFLPCLLAQDGPLSIENVTLIDGTGRPPQEHVCVLIEQQHISDIAACPLAVPSQAVRIDGVGKFLLPGLFDVHVHLGQGLVKTGTDLEAGIRSLAAYLYCGVTTIADLGNDADFIYSLRERERSGAIQSPRLLVSGGITTYIGGAGASNASATQADSWPVVIPKLDTNIARHPDFLSLIYDERGWGMYPRTPILPRELAGHIIEHYADFGVRSTAHAFSEARIREAIFLGMDTLAQPPIEAPVTSEFVRLVAAKRIPIASALSTLDSLSRLGHEPEYLDEPLYRATIKPDDISKLKSQSAGLRNDRWAEWRRLFLSVASENVEKIDEAGGVVALGTDLSVGAAVHRELELLVAAKIPPLHVIRIATFNSAVFLGLQQETGSVEKGKLADLILLDADPLADIRNTKRINLVIRKGHIVNRQNLDLPRNRALVIQSPNSR
jgi:imidazolonepropionase-like amidohydrolase